MIRRLAIVIVLLAGCSPAAAQIQPGPNLSPNGRMFTFAPRAGYLGPPAAIFPFPYGPPPLAYGPPSGPPPAAYGPPPGELCVVDPEARVSGLLNVRASPNGWPIGLLGNGTQILIREYAGDWVHVVAPIDGWVFRPLLVCQPPPLDAYALAPPPRPRQAELPSERPAPQAQAAPPRPPVGSTSPGARRSPYERQPDDGAEPYSPPVPEEMPR
jgi:hypothetical protein